MRKLKTRNGKKSKCGGRKTRSNKTRRRLWRGGARYGETPSIAKARELREFAETQRRLYIDRCTPVWKACYELNDELGINECLVEGNCVRQ